MKKGNIYYSFWVGLIQNYLNRYKPNNDIWKEFLLLNVSAVFGVGLSAIVFLLKVLNIYKIELIQLDVLPGKTLDYTLSFIINFVLIFYVINYLLIFRKDRYKSLNNKYKGMHKKYLAVILFSILLIWLLIMLIHGFVIGNIFKF